MAAMGTDFDLFCGSNRFLHAFDFSQHLLKALLIPFLFGNRQLFSHLVIKLFDFGFKDRDEIFHRITLVVEVEADVVPR